MSFKPSRWLRLGSRVGSCGPGELSPFNSKVEMGQHLENTHSYPMMPGSPCPGVPSSARSNSELPPPPAPFSPLLAGLARHLGLGCLKELTLKQASFSSFKGNIRNHSPSYRAQHILINVLPALPPHHTLSQDGSPRLSRMCRGTPDTAEQMVEPGFRPRSA